MSERVTTCDKKRGLGGDCSEAKYVFACITVVLLCPIVTPLAVEL